MGFAAVQTLVGVTKLSELGIDIDKNWLTYLIKNLGDPVDAQDAATRAYVLAQLGSYLPLAGGTMAGEIAMGTNKITGLGAPVANNDAARKVEVDTLDGKFNDVSYSAPARAVATEYQNISGKIRLCVVSVYCKVESLDGELDGSAWFNAKIGPTSPPANWVGQAGLYVGNLLRGLTAGTNRLASNFSIAFLVPPTWYYIIVLGKAGDGAWPTEALWREYDLH